MSSKDKTKFKNQHFAYKNIIAFGWFVSVSFIVAGFIGLATFPVVAGVVMGIMAAIRGTDAYLKCKKTQASIEMEVK